MPAISTRMPPVSVEYDKAGTRAIKFFPDAYVARRFFTRQDKLGNNPKVVGAKTMSEQTTPAAEVTETAATVETTTAKKPARRKKATAKPAAAATKKSSTKKAAVKKSAAKPAPVKKASTKKASPKTKVAKSGSFNWSPKRVAIVQTMRKLKAFDGTTAKTGEEISAKAGDSISQQDVKHYCYKDNDLVTGGFVLSAKIEGSTLLHYYLTKKGQTVEI